MEESMPNSEQLPKHFKLSLLLYPSLMSDQCRKVYVPSYRYKPLKKVWKDHFYIPISEQMKIKVRMNLKTRHVELKTRPDTPDVSNLQKCADFLSAFMLGFDVSDAKALLEDDSLFVESFDIQDVKISRGDQLSQAIGQLSGERAKTKIVVAYDTVHIMGTSADIQVARDALCRLIHESSVAKLYSKL